MDLYVRWSVRLLSWSSRESWPALNVDRGKSLSKGFLEEFDRHVDDLEALVAQHTKPRPSRREVEIDEIPRSSLFFMFFC